jgi:SAM-dependent methyltransferase
VTWEERITRETDPSIVTDHVLRYAFAAPAIAEAAVWGDAGCGSGLAARLALGPAVNVPSLLVDISTEAVDAAKRELRGTDVTGIAADLASEEGVASLREAVLHRSGGKGGCITCFEVLEHLENFVPLVRALGEFAGEHGFVVFLSVPNDAFWTIENPYHATTWGDGAFEELRRLLPTEHTIALQFPLRGSAIVSELTPDDARVTLETTLRPSGIPSHFIAVLGEHSGAAEPLAAVEQGDLEAERRWARQRESNLAFAEARVAELDRRIAELEQRLTAEPV